MKKALLCMLGVLMLGVIFLSQNVLAQGNIAWEELWVHSHPLSTNGTFGWMAGQRQYTGLAYDHVRDVVYIVNPAVCQLGQSAWACPKIWVLDAMSGLIKTSVGRDAAGQGGQLSVPTDTIHGFPTLGWPNGSFGSFSQGIFPIYKIDVDDEGRIFVGNLVAPIWGICFPGPPPNCDPIYLAQGPYRIFRYDKPSDAPKRVYATLNPTATGIGSYGNSEMAWSRWGDVLTVVGRRGVYDTPDGPKVVDSARIFTSGGVFNGQTVTNRDIAVILGDTRPDNQRVSNGMGGLLEYRLAINLVSSIEGLASHGIAPTGTSAISEIWMDNNARVTTLNNQGQTNDPWPQTVAMTRMHALSSNKLTGTGDSGPLAFFKIPASGKQYLVCADGLPENPNDPQAPNSNTRARIMDVTITGQELRDTACCGYDTPLLGNKTLQSNSGVNNYIADVDFKIDPDPVNGRPHVILYVLMSNNGIGAFRSRDPIYVPVELSTFNGTLKNSIIDLRWEVTSESNNYGFEIERSFNNGGTWEMIGFVQGRGTTNLPKQYTFEDPVTSVHLSLPSVKYRLRQIDTDGTSTHSPVVEVRMDASPTNIYLSQNYPNPFNPTTSIQYYLPKAGYVTLKIFNPLGEEVATLINGYQDAGPNTVHFKSGTMPSGTYVYQLSVDGETLQKKMVLAK